MKFNRAQQQAIAHKKGPMLVLAGPGSGKTLVITERTKRLIEQEGIEPHKILVITFTKAAASEMKERFQKMMKGAYAPVQFGTFHAVFFTILKHAYHYNVNNIVRDDQRKQIFREILDKIDIEIEDENEFISDIESEISLVKGEMINLDHYYSIHCSEEIFKQIYQMYHDKLQKQNLIDFDDMLVYCYELLKARKDIRKIWQKQFEYILIDEFQDINKVQYEVIKILSEKHKNLFVVGDDDQSIYRFRGAKPEIMLHFEKDFPNVQKTILDMNYRCSGNIVKGAAKVVQHNKKRFAKQITTNNEDGEAIRIANFPELRLENSKVVEELLRYKEMGISFSEMAILFRTNTQPRALLEKLMEFNIPFRIKDQIPNIYEHWIAKNIIAYIKIALGSRERALFLQIANRPKRYLSREIFDTPFVDFERLRTYYDDKNWMMERIDRLEYDIKVLAKMNPYAAINYIRKGIAYEEYLTEYAAFRRIKPEELMDTLDEIQEAAKPFKTFEEWFTHIEEYGEELRKQAKMRKDTQEDSITMATMHSAKGLEYRVVFIIDANEGITPHRKAIIPADMEEERRMFYVAMTRAKDFLHIYYVKERYNKELEMSRFLRELIG